MRTTFPNLVAQSFGATIARTIAVVLLTPLIVVAGLCAVVAFAVMALSRRAALALAAPQRPAGARPILRLEPVPAEHGVGAIGQRAA